MDRPPTDGHKPNTRPPRWRFRKRRLRGLVARAGGALPLECSHRSACAMSGTRVRIANALVAVRTMTIGQNRSVTPCAMNAPVKAGQQRRQNAANTTSMVVVCSRSKRCGSLASRKIKYEPKSASPQLNT